MNLKTNFYRSWIEIDLKTIYNNICFLRRRIPKNTKFVVMVKADAYGHGILEISKISQKAGAFFLGVNFLEEAIFLRKNNITCPIILFTQPDSNLISYLDKYKITPAVYSLAFLKQLVLWLKKNHKKIQIHLKINTGLNRFGFNLKNITDAIYEIKKNVSIINIDGVFTHFSSASSNKKRTEKEFSLFEKVIKKIKAEKITINYLHSSNSAALILYKKYSLNLVRFGLAVYGLKPFKNKKKLIPIKQAFSWKTKVINISEIKKNETVGYDGSWIAIKNSTVGVIPVGYSDGFRRTPSNYSCVLCCGNKVPIIGEVMMNHTIIDLTEIKKKVRLGSEVVIIGKQGNKTITFEEIALNAKTINEEIVTSISLKIPRVYIGNK
jgi:alanine racemase